MKVGILTFHDGINFGAFLQVYSLYNVIKDLGYDVEVINYKNYKHWADEYKFFLLRKNLIEVFKNFKKIKKFRKCLHLIRCSKFSFYIDKQSNYNTIFIGSDEVWNYKVVPDYSAYFGIGLKTNKLCSYAASFGNTSAQDELPQNIKEALSYFKFISVRDESSKAILIKNGINDSKLVCDPTLLYEIPDKIIKYDRRIKTDSYILFYASDMEDENIIQQIKDFAKRENLLLISVGYEYKWCDKNMISISPFEWIGYIKNAKYVITTMFHGFCFCLKYHKQFALIIEEYRINKIQTLTSLINCENRFLCKKNNLSDIFSKELDYNAINTKLKNFKNNSMEWICAALGEKE